MITPISRREFLKLSGLAAGGLALNPFPSRRLEDVPGVLIRAAYPSVSIYRKAEMDSPIVGQWFRDELINVYYELRPADGPAYNPLWYRVWNGFMHSAYTQPVEIGFNLPLDEVREGGQLAEVSVPYTQAHRYTRYAGWQPLNRLYYQTTHWLTGIDQGPDGEAWYRITDELQPIDYHAPATHFRPVADEEFAPISPHIPPEEKRIEISRETQSLTALEGDQIIFRTKVSTGIPNSLPGPNGIPTMTPSGRFRIFDKLPSKHMGSGRLTDGLEDNALLGVPWTCFFVETGVALHGTFWHNNFGWPMSRGCVNLRNEDAKWLFRWTTPTSGPADWSKRGFGTQVVIS